MTLGHARLPAWLVALSALLAGCTGPQLLNLNTDLVRLQEQKSTLEKQARGSARDAATVQLAHIDGELERVFEAATSAARQVFDTKAKISYYRIASTAGWQRTDVRTVALAQEGSELCNRSNGFDVAPRDCAMLLIIPDLLVNDVWAAKFSAMVAEARAPGFSGGLAAKYRRAAEDLVLSYRGLEQAESRVGGTGLPPVFLGVMRARRAAIARNLNQVLNLFVTRRVTQADTNAVASICADIRIMPRPYCQEGVSLSELEAHHSRANWKCIQS